MEELDERYMKKIKDKLKALDMPNREELIFMCMLFNELRQLNINIETLLEKLKK